MSTETVSVCIPEPHFTLFNARRDGLPEVIVVNDALLTFPHHELFPWHLRVRLEAKETVENGMPSPAESEVLSEIGDTIEAAVLDGRTRLGARNSLFLARSTWNDLRELLFQVHDPEIANAALQGLLDSKSWSRPWEYRMQEDPEWKEAAHVFTLFPMADGNDG